MKEIGLVKIITLFYIVFIHPQLDEIKHLIASQPSSIEAVRLKCLLQPPVQLAKSKELLAKHEVSVKVLKFLKIIITHTARAL